jgi:hypothetical protein
VSARVWQPAAMGMGRTTRGAAALTAVVVAVLCLAGGAHAADSTLLFKFADAQIDESSGLGTSSYGDGIVYTHNDSGDTARFFAVNSRGTTVAIYTLKGATAHDWEDMETGTDASGKPVLYFGDIGDNSAKRTEIDVYQVPEPRGPSASVPWVRYRFAYPDGSHNAETLMVDPHTHRIFIASKAALGDGLLYEAPAVLSTTAINRLAVVVPQRTVPMLTTSGDISPDGKLMVLLTYFAAYWSVGVNGELHEFPVTEQRQDEAIAFTRDGKSVLVGSEGVHSAVYRIALPAEAIAADAAPNTPPTPTTRPTTKPVPTVKPTVKPTATTKPTPSSSAQISSPVTASLPTSSTSPSFESPAPAPASSALVTTLPVVSSAASPPSPSTSASDSFVNWVPWFVLAIVVCGIVLSIARRFRWWPWRRT